MSEHYTEQIQPVRLVRDKEMVVRGKTIEYRMIGEDIIIPGEDGGDAFDFFCFSYIRTDIDNEEERPVIFVFNGGPTVDSSWLHLGFYGPRIVAVTEEGLPDEPVQGRLRDNPDCVLDMADIVMIDPVNTGFSRLLNSRYGDECFGDHKDARAVAKFVRTWLTVYHRENSLVYLSCESYGSTRASLMTRYLQPECRISGIIHIGPGYSNDEETLRTYKDLMPAAATKWYYEDEPADSLEERMAGCRKFLYEEYVPAYYLGSDLPYDRKIELANQLENWTGLEASYFLTHGLKVDRRDFRRMILSDRGLKVGDFDTRFTLPLEEETEPFTARVGEAYSKGMKTLCEENEINIDRVYRRDSYQDDPLWNWDYCSQPGIIGLMANAETPAQATSAAMSRNPEMRLFFATGYYDTVATVENTRYAVSHSDVPGERVTIREYASGHAVYVDEQSRAQLARDVREFLRESI